MSECKPSTVKGRSSSRNNRVGSRADTGDRHHDREVIQALRALVSALVHALEAQKARPALRIRAFTHAEGHRGARGGGRGTVSPRLRLARAGAQGLPGGNREAGPGRACRGPVYADGALLGGRS